MTTRKLKVDSGLMFCAIGRDPNPNEECTGFLDRETGAILFTFEGSAPLALDDLDVRIDAVFDRAEIESNPDKWIEIPKYCGEQGDEDGFIGEFFQEHGIQAALT